MTAINTNVNSLVTQTALRRNEVEMSNAMTRLSTGKRINTAADDAAGRESGTACDQVLAASCEVDAFSCFCTLPLFFCTFEGIRRLIQM